MPAVARDPKLPHRESRRGPRGETGAAAFHADRDRQPDVRFDTFRPQTFGACDLPGGGAGAPVPDEPGSFWFVVVADCGEESSLGRDSLGRLRARPEAGCP